MLECLEITEDRVKPSGPLPRADVAETVEALYLQAQEYRELMEQALASIKVDREKVQAALDAATRESFEARQKGEDAERMRLEASRILALAKEELARIRYGTQTSAEALRHQYA